MAEKETKCVESPNTPINSLLIDLYKSESKKNKKLMIFSIILLILLFVSVNFCCILLNELNNYEKVSITETTVEESYENDIDGNNANVVNGNQYNDSATHNEGETQTNKEVIE